MPTGSAPTTRAFRGIPLEAAGFFARLTEHNTRAFWQEHRDVYEQTVRGPFLDLLTTLGEGYGPWRVYRPQRDTRFSKDKSPYKTFIGAVCQREGGTGFFVQVDARGLMAAGGYPMMASDQLERYRAAVDDPRTGPELEALLAALAAEPDLRIKSGYPEPLKTAPRGYRRDHPRVERLRWKGVECFARFGTPDWLATPAAADRVRDAWERMEPMNVWLDHHVGASRLSPEEIWGR